MNVLLTGKRQVGKTTICRQVADLACELGYNPAGVLAPAVRGKDGLPVAYHALMVSDGEQRLLAWTNGDLGKENLQPETRNLKLSKGGPHTGRYSFDAAVFSWVIESLRVAISQGCDLLIVDEIGPLELEQEKGLAPLLSDLIKREIGQSQNGSPPQVRVSESPQVRVSEPSRVRVSESRTCSGVWDSLARWELPRLLLVVRPELVAQLQKQLPGIPFRTFTVTQENRQALPQAVVEELFVDHDPGR
jgi:nucleoside-triphosphatase THEP1